MDARLIERRERHPARGSLVVPLERHPVIDGTDDDRVSLDGIRRQVRRDPVEVRASLRELPPREDGRR